MLALRSNSRGEYLATRPALAWLASFSALIAPLNACTGELWPVTPEKPAICLWGAKYLRFLGECGEN